MTSDFSDVMKKSSVKIKGKRLGVISMLSLLFVYCGLFASQSLLTLMNARVHKTPNLNKMPCCRRDNRTMHPM